MLWIVPRVLFIVAVHCASLFTGIHGVTIHRHYSPVLFIRKKNLEFRPWMLNQSEFCAFETFVAILMAMDCKARCNLWGPKLRTVGTCVWNVIKFFMASWRIGRQWGSFLELITSFYILNICMLSFKYSMLYIEDNASFKCGGRIAHSHSHLSRSFFFPFEFIC